MAIAEYQKFIYKTLAFILALAMTISPVSFSPAYAESIGSANQNQTPTIDPLALNPQVVNSSNNSSPVLQPLNSGSIAIPSNGIAESVATLTLNSSETIETPGLLGKITQIETKELNRKSSQTKLFSLNMTTDKDGTPVTFSVDKTKLADGTISFKGYLERNNKRTFWGVPSNKDFFFWGYGNASEGYYHFCIIEGMENRKGQSTTGYDNILNYYSELTTETVIDLTTNADGSMNLTIRVQTRLANGGSQVVTVQAQVNTGGTTAANTTVTGNPAGQTISNQISNQIQVTSVTVQTTQAAGGNSSVSNGQNQDAPDPAQTAQIVQDALNTLNSLAGLLGTIVNGVSNLQGATQVSLQQGLGSQLTGDTTPQNAATDAHFNGVVGVPASSQQVQAMPLGLQGILNIFEIFVNVALPHIAQIIPQQIASMQPTQVIHGPLTRTVTYVFVPINNSGDPNVFITDLKDDSQADNKVVIPFSRAVDPQAFNRPQALGPLTQQDYYHYVQQQKASSSVNETPFPVDANDIDANGNYNFDRDVSPEEQMLLGRFAAIQNLNDLNQPIPALFMKAFTNGDYEAMKTLFGFWQQLTLMRKAAKEFRDKGKKVVFVLKKQNDQDEEVDVLPADFTDLRGVNNIGLKVFNSDGSVFDLPGPASLASSADTSQSGKARG